MAVWDGFFSDEELNEIRDLLIEDGYDTQAKLDYLRSGLPAQYRAGLDGGTLVPRQQVMLQLRQMNGSYVLRNGETPFKTVLNQALNDSNDADRADHYEQLIRTIDSTPAPSARMLRAQPLAYRSERAAAMAAALSPNFATAGAIGISEEVLTNALDNTVSVDFLQKGAEVARSVFKIVVRRYFDGEQEFLDDSTPVLGTGTGWMIAPGLAITNHHVIDARKREWGESSASDADLKKQAATAEILFDYLDADDVPTALVPGDGALQAFSPRSQLDYAILRFSEPVPARKPLRLAIRKKSKRIEQALGPRVNVLQHPDGRPMRLGFRNNYIVVGDDDILAYLTDTQFGSSGSPVLDDKWTVVALHRGARGISREDIKILQTLVKQENIGTQISRIMKDLEERYPVVHAEILQGQATVFG